MFGMPTGDVRLRSRARCFALCENQAVRAIVLLKFERIEPLWKWFAQRVAEVHAKDADVVVSVPLHRDREKERGQNQAELLSKPLAKLLRLPHRGVLLVRKRPRRQSLR